MIRVWESRYTASAGQGAKTAVARLLGRARIRVPEPSVTVGLLPRSDRADQILLCAGNITGRDSRALPLEGCAIDPGTQAVLLRLGRHIVVLIPHVLIVALKLHPFVRPPDGPGTAGGEKWRRGNRVD